MRYYTISYLSLLVSTLGRSQVAGFAVPFLSGRGNTKCSYQTSLGSTASSPVVERIQIPADSVESAVTQDVSEQSTRPSKHDRKRKSSSNNSNNNCWILKLYNDQDNYEFWVAEQLVKITGLTELQAFYTMKEADATGEATIAEYDCTELAEHYHGALQAEGLAVKLIPSTESL